MSDRAWLEGHNCDSPPYYLADTESIACQKNALPLGWLALFNKEDVYLLQDPDEEPQEEEESDDEDRYYGAPTLFTSRESALINLQRRMKLYSGRLSSNLLPENFLQFYPFLEQAVAACKSKYVQVFLNEFEFWKLDPDSVGEIQACIDSIDTCDPDEWASTIRYLYPDYTPTFSNGEKTLSKMHLDFHRYAHNRAWTLEDENLDLSVVFVGDVYDTQLSASSE